MTRNGFACFCKINPRDRSSCSRFVWVCLFSSHISGTMVSGLLLLSGCSWVPLSCHILVQEAVSILGPFWGAP